MKKRLLAALKIAVPLAILVVLVVDIRRNDPTTFSRLANQPKDWLRISAGTALVLTAVCITFFRWYLLVRALGLPFRTADAFRLGFLAYLLNFVSVGAVGGDLFKAVFIAREQPGRRTEAVASVVVDRVIGLFGMLLVCSTALLLLGNRLPDELRYMSWAIYALTGGFLLGLLLLLAPGITTGRLGKWIFALPKIGHICERVAAALLIYSRKRGVLAVTVILATLVHVLIGAGMFLTASGMYASVPTLLDHVVIVALSNAVAALPIAPNGLGTYELAMKFLYTAIPAGMVEEGSGLVVALCYRAITIFVAAIGVVYYWTNRRRVRQLMHEAEELAEHEDEDLAHAAGLPWPEDG